ncbi:unnamed protein product [Adineta steineri]|uniref:Uncharacterized protein n=1 Tax=Adineta steineri TaxID=433720 RepID=A0A816DQI8_9BILA|nr:unnamed protein product [Adineta steineri]CAF1640164.1 unnamed protein product [Adineta steineri]
MANKTQCFTCKKEKITYPCEGCSQRFCLIHLPEHQQGLTEELNCIIDDYNEFTERINGEKQNLHNHSLIEQINQWERNSIEQIQQKAQECRETVIESSRLFINDIENKFNDLNKQIQELHTENDFNEINLNYLRNQLGKVTEELNDPSKISIQKYSQACMNEISFILSRRSKWGKWKQNAITVAGGNEEGEELDQLDSPHGIFIDKNKTIFIADCGNDRIVEWKYNAEEGQIIAGGNDEGDRIDQLNGPIDVIVDQENHSIIIADQGNRRVVQWLNQKQQILINNIDCSRLVMDKYGFLYVSDYMKDEVKRWKMGEYNNEGIVVAGGNGEGYQLNQLNCPTVIFVDEDQSVYVSDWESHRVMKWRKGAKEGRIVAGGNGKGGNLNQLSSPEGIYVGDLGEIYLADSGNHRVMRWCEGKEEGEVVVGGNGEGDQPDQFSGPSSLSFNEQGSLYVTDDGNARIQKFEIIL